MKKDFDYEDEIQKEEMSRAHWERVRILVKIIPFVLIIVILAITLLVDRAGAHQQDDGEEAPKEVLSLETTAVPSGEQSESDVLTTPVPEQEQEPEQTEESENPTPTPYREIMEEADYSKVKFSTKEQLSEMMAYWADNNQPALDDLANLDRFKAMSWQLSGTEDFYYYGDTNAAGQPHGKGIAVYADNQYYYGDWKEGKRSGGGTWIHYHIHTKPNNTDIYTYHQYAGLWKNNLPDGEGAEHYDLNSEALKENQYYSTNLIGSYAQGLIDGEFYITTIEKNNNIREWEAQAEQGAWIYQNNSKDKKGNRTVQVDIHDPDNYIWMSPKDNHDIGIPCLITPDS